MNHAIVVIAAAAFVAHFAGDACAKLPDATPEAKAKADVAKAENAHKDKIADYQLCQAQDKAAKRYLASPAGKGRKAESLPACTDPGKFVPPPAAVVAVAPAPAAAPAAAPAKK